MKQRPDDRLQPADYVDIVEAALHEDLGERDSVDPARDLTTVAVIPADSASRARIVARAPGVVAGLDVASHVFARLDSAVEFHSRVPDGAIVTPEQVLATVAGPTRAILTGERTALNLLSRMSGVATATRRFVDAVAGTGARITDTRKTMPGLRQLDKYAVRMGGGVNHRFGLYDAVMVKDNHIAAAGSLRDAVARSRTEAGDGVMIVVEVDSLDQLAEALDTSADRVLLDNMEPDVLRAAVRRVRASGREIDTEASGGITLASVRTVAETGVDLVSIGRITHSAPELDIALDLGS